MSEHQLTLRLHPETFSVGKLAPTETIPAWALDGKLFSITRTANELSIVCESERIPADVTQETGWRCLQVDGPLDFSMIGVLTALLNPLAQNGVSVFVISTFDTDYLFIKASVLEQSIQVLTESGHEIV